MRAHSKLLLPVVAVCACALHVLNLHNVGSAGSGNRPPKIGQAGLLRYPSSNPGHAKIDWVWPKLESALANTTLRLDNHAEYAAVIVEMRCTPLLKLVVVHNLAMLGPGWQLYVFHGTHNAQCVRDALQSSVSGPGLVFVDVGVAQLNDSSYNRLLKGSTFWETFTKATPTPIKRCLVFQLDSLILQRGRAFEFTEFDFIGAPWHAENDAYSGINEARVPIPALDRSQRVGNGGFSIRNPAAMLAVLTKYAALSNDHEQEDVFFVRFLWKFGFIVAPLDKAVAFALEVPVENEYYQNQPYPWAIHQAWLYTPWGQSEMTQELMDSALRKAIEAFEGIYAR